TGESGIRHRAVAAQFDARGARRGARRDFRRMGVSCEFTQHAVDARDRSTLRLAPGRVLSAARARAWISERTDGAAHYPVAVAAGCGGGAAPGRGMGRPRAAGGAGAWRRVRRCETKGTRTPFVAR